MTQSGYQTIIHEFAPVYNEEYRILILGTLPSVKSREGHFYYHHPRNRFWQVISSLTGEPLPLTIPEKKAMLLRHGIAIWDVVAQCDIIGSSDSSIRNVIPADIRGLLKKTSIDAVYTNGQTAHRLYQKYSLPLTGLQDCPLPSTSPANAAFSLEKLLEIWGEKVSRKIF